MLRYLFGRFTATVVTVGSFVTVREDDGTELTLVPGRSLGRRGDLSLLSAGDRIRVIGYTPTMPAHALIVRRIKKVNR